VTVTDTAGIRDDAVDEIEKVGISRAVRSCENADLRLLVVDAVSVHEQHHDGVADWRPTASRCVRSGPTIVLLNKVDALTEDAIKRVESRVRSHFDEKEMQEMQSRPKELLHVSCTANIGLEAIVVRVRDSLQAILKGDGTFSSDIITRERHREHLRACEAHLELTKALLDKGEVVIAAEELRLAVEELASIVGRVDVEDLLDVVFQDFCIGK